MKDIRHLYEEIVNDIDGPEMGVVWSHDHISRPHVRKVKKPKSKLGDHNLITESSTCQDSEPGSAVKTFKAMTSHAETKVPGHHGPSVAETEIQTDGFLDVDEQNWPAQDINPNCSLRQFQEHVNFKDKLVKIQPSIVSSEVQTDEADLPSFQPHKTCAAVQVSPDISDHVVLNKPSQADDVPYDVEQHSRGGRSGLEAGASEEDVSLPGKLEHHMAENCEDLGESETRSLSGETDAADHEHQGGRNTVTRAADLKQGKSDVFSFVILIKVLFCFCYQD